MNRKLITHLYWVIPTVIMIFGLFLLSYQNFSKVTEPPAPDWSRALFIGKTDINKLPPVRILEDGSFIFTRFENGKLATTTINKDFIIQDQQTYDIPVDKWTQVFQKAGTIIYFDFKNIYDLNRNIIVSDVEKFYPLEKTIFYIKEKELYQLTPENMKSKKIMDVDLNKLDIILQEDEAGVKILVYTSDPTGVDISLQQISNGKMNTIYQTRLKVDPGKVVNDIAFALNDEKLALLLQEELEQTQGKPEFFTYIMETNLNHQDAQPLHRLSFEDPAGSHSLKEVSDVELKYNNGKPTILFKANGRTETRYNDDTTFNIYTAVISQNGTTKTERRSNTPEISTNPQWINDETIAWLDIGAKDHKINIATANIDKVSRLIKVTQDDWLNALGKTLGMITSSFFGVALSVIWFLWPIIFIVVMYFFKHRTIDRDPTWFFYTGIGLYILAAIIWKDRFFVDRIYSKAPDYLTFNGSSYFYMFVFAIIAYWLSIHTKKVNDWSGTARIIYFVGLHVLLLTIFFGPYII